MEESKAIRAVELVRQIRDKQAVALSGKSPEEIIAFFHRAAEMAREAARQRRLAELARERITRALAARQQAAVLAAQQSAAATDQAPGAAPGLVGSPAATSIPTTTAGGHPEAATIATRYLGVPYVWGGASPAGFDCSGLVMYVYAQLGISLPHYTVSQWNATIPISLSQLEPGDLLFFDGLGHVGIYIGGGQFVHAPQTGDVVKISPLSEFPGSRYVGARRLP